MTSSSAEAHNASHNVAQWLKETMKLQNTNNVAVKKISTCFVPFCKGTAISSMWKNMATHIRPKDQVDAVKKDIELDNLRAQQEERIVELQCRKRKLKAMRDELRSLKVQVADKREKIQFINQRVIKSKDAEKKIKIKSQMHKSYEELLTEQTARCKAYLDWIRELVVTYNRDDHRDDQFSDVLLRSAVSRVKDALACVEDKSRVYPIIRDLLQNYSPKIITLVLITVLQEYVNNVRNDAESFDIEKEMTELRCRIQESSQSYGAQGGTTMHDMLQLWNTECVGNYAELTQNEQEYRKKMKEAARIRRDLLEKIDEIYEFEPANLRGAVDSLDVEADLTTSRIRLQKLREGKVEIADEIQRKREARQHVSALKGKLAVGLNAIREDQKVLFETKRVNSNTAASLQGRQRQVQRVGLESVCSKQSGLETICASAQVALRSRSSAFNRVEMDRLCRVETLEGLTPITDLTIHRYSDVSEDNGGFSYQKSLCRLSIHGHVPPSVAWRTILDVKTDIERLNFLKSSIDNTGTENITAELEDLFRQCRDSEARILQTLDPRCKNAVQLADHASRECARLRDCVEIWYEQPAQHQTPWITVNGMNFEEWKAARRK